ncbi:MAG: argininosuccinate lyase [Ignavibacteria bacterium]|jgi:argininosuccinate lyase
MLWGGRFEEALDNAAMSFSSSLSFDKILIEEEIAVSKAHAKMLAKVGIINRDESKKIINGLDEILSKWKSGNLILDENKFEDIHSAVEAYLFELIGDTAGKLHSGRSRNDQVVTIERLWVIKTGKEIINSINEFLSVLLNRAEQHIETIIPGYTHLQRAQPVSLAFHLLAYFEMLKRDSERFKNVIKECDECPMGSAALAGSTLPLDREFIAKELGFSKPTENALDTVSNRDFLLDFLNAVNLCMMHLSRLSEELILWSSSEFYFIVLSDKLTTGSSLMPQKKNPDMAELIRGKSGRVSGNYISLLTTMKGLPLSYNRDMQEDKEPVFDSYFTLINSLKIMTGMIGTMEVNSSKFLEELKNDFSLATDLADWLVIKGVPFREAHSIIGSLVKKMEGDKTTFSEISVKYLRELNPIFDESALEILQTENPLKNKKTYGSPNPNFVKEQILNYKLKIAK